VAFIQSDHHTVDAAGYKAVTPAARCSVATAATSIPGSSRVPLRNPVVRKRSRLLIRHNSGPAATIWIGGDGASTTVGYPIANAGTIDLPLTPGVIVLAATTTQVSSSGIRTLETG